MSVAQETAPSAVVPASDGHSLEQEALFREARQRRRRRWLTAGAVLVAAILFVSILVFAMASGGDRKVTPTGELTPKPTAVGTSIAATFSIRPLLCYAPVFVATTGPATSGPLPTCGPQYQLSASNLNVTPTGSSDIGYRYSNVRSDPAFAAYPSTTVRDDTGSAKVLLAGGGELSTYRFILGPAALARGDIESATALRSAGWWSVRLNFTPAGSARLDSFAQSQLHQFVAVVVNNRVVYTPLIEPAQPTFSTLGGTLTFGGSAGLSPGQAKAIAARL